MCAVAVQVLLKNQQNPSFVLQSQVRQPFGLSIRPHHPCLKLCSPSLN